MAHDQLADGLHRLLQLPHQHLKAAFSGGGPAQEWLPAAFAHVVAGPAVRFLRAGFASRSDDRLIISVLAVGELLDKISTTQDRSTLINVLQQCTRRLCEDESLPLELGARASLPLVLLAAAALGALEVGDRAERQRLRLSGLLRKVRKVWGRAFDSAEAGLILITSSGIPGLSSCTGRSLVQALLGATPESMWTPEMISRAQSLAARGFQGSSDSLHRLHACLLRISSLRLPEQAPALHEAARLKPQDQRPLQQLSLDAKRYILQRVTAQGQEADEAEAWSEEDPFAAHELQANPRAAHSSLRSSLSDGEDDEADLLRREVRPEADHEDEGNSIPRAPTSLDRATDRASAIPQQRILLDAYKKYGAVAFARSKESRESLHRAQIKRALASLGDVQRKWDDSRIEDWAALLERNVSVLSDLVHQPTSR